MTAARVQSAWESIQAQAAAEHKTHRSTLVRHRSELSRVISHFGVREALEFAGSELGISSLAFLHDFELLEQGEKFGVFAI